MLSCLSVGISNYRNDDLTAIPCAKRDAHTVYHAFQRIMGVEFNHYLSMCVSNIRSSEFESLLAVISGAIASDIDQADSILVIYFSGHGKYNGQTLELCFPDFSGNGKSTDDLFPVNRFLDIFRNQNIKILIILDCCYSGGALAFASDSEQRPEISVLASVSSSRSSKFDEGGSVFTKTLCKSIHDIERSGETFSLSALIGRIKANGYTDAYVHRGAARELDILFRGQQTTDGFDQYFVDRFVDRVAHSSALSREALWYALNDFPDKKVFDTCARYFGINGIHGKAALLEANWLVRRAIGSTLANHVSYSPIRALLEQLLESAYWQEQCIALIGLRYLMQTDNEACDRVIGLVAKKRIRRVDAVWLAALYTSDNKKTDWSVFLDTTLALTPWGMIELCKAFGLFERGMDDDRLHSHCFFEELVAEKRRREKIECTSLEEYAYSEDSRGRLPVNSKAKFLLSALYGNWRDQVLLNLGPYFECTDDRQVKAELTEFCNIRNAERKMALFAYLNREYEKIPIDLETVKWGLSDEHPWVRRSAMEFYQRIGSNNEALKESYYSVRFADGYPGLLDFYLTCPASLCQDLIHYLKTERIISNEDFRSLEQSFSCQ